MDRNASDPEWQDYLLRAPCPQCGGTEGRIHWDQNGQDVVYCKPCNRHLYNAPKSESGRVARTLRTIRHISPSQRSRLMERAHWRCEICGTTENLTVAHIVSVKKGFNELTDAELNSDDNQIVACAECNAGMGINGPAPWVLIRLVKQRTQPPPSDRKPARQEFFAWLEQMRGRLTDEQIERGQVLIGQVIVEAKREVEDEHKRQELEAWRKKRREEDDL